MGLLAGETSGKVSVTSMDWNLLSQGKYAETATNAFLGVGWKEPTRVPRVAIGTHVILRWRLVSLLVAVWEMHSSCEHPLRPVGCLVVSVGANGLQVFHKSDMIVVAAPVSS